MRFSFDKGVNGVGNVHRREYLGEIVRASRPANGMKQARHGAALPGAARLYAALHHMRRLAGAFNGAFQSFSAGHSPEAILRDSAKRHVW